MKNNVIPRETLKKLEAYAPKGKDIIQELNIFNSNLPSGIRSDTRGYLRIKIYMQRGLANYGSLLKYLIKFILKFQHNFSVKYYELLCDTINESGTVKGYGYLVENSNYKYNDKVIKKMLLNATGDITKSGPAIISVITAGYGIFEKEDILMGDIFNNILPFDLIVVIGKKNEIYLNKALESIITDEIKKRFLFIEINDDDVKYYIGDECMPPYK